MDGGKKEREKGMAFPTPKGPYLSLDFSCEPCPSWVLCVSIAPALSLCEP